MCPGVRRRRGLGGLSISLVVLSAGGMLSTLLLLPAPCFCSWLFRSGSWVVFWSFCISLSIIYPNCTCTQLILVPYSFFVLSCLGRRGDVCPGASPAAKGPRSQVPSVSIYATPANHVISVMLRLTLYKTRFCPRSLRKSAPLLVRHCTSLIHRLFPLNEGHQATLFYVCHLTCPYSPPQKK